MPIKEVVTFALGMVISIALVGGPIHLRQHLREMQIKILREMTRVDNWGEPSALFRHTKSRNGFKSSLR
jgi:hypothetical protein